MNVVRKITSKVARIRRDRKIAAICARYPNRHDLKVVVCQAGLHYWDARGENAPTDEYPMCKMCRAGLPANTVETCQ